MGTVMWLWLLLGVGVGIAILYALFKFEDAGEYGLLGVLFKTLIALGPTLVLSVLAYLAGSKRLAVLLLGTFISFGTLWLICVLLAFVVVPVDKHLAKCRSSERNCCRPSSSACEQRPFPQSQTKKSIITQPISTK